MGMEDCCRKEMKHDDYTGDDDEENNNHDQHNAKETPNKYKYCNLSTAPLSSVIFSRICDPSLSVMYYYRI